MVVRVYTHCKDPYSDMLKNLLQYYAVEFENVDVSKAGTALQEMIEASGQSKTPVLVINKKVFVGFDREKIKEVLGVDKKE